MSIWWTRSSRRFSNHVFCVWGGISGFTSLPSYQSAAVNAYLSSGVSLPPVSYYNSLGRGSPDVSAIGHDVVVNVGGVLYLVDASGPATPIFAGMVARLNEI